MPRRAAFYGIVIWMYRPDHPPPHFHARYGEDEARVELGTWRVINGSLPARALRLVREWAELHENELSDNWERAQALATRSDRSPSDYEPPSFDLPEARRAGV